MNFIAIDAEYTNVDNQIFDIAFIKANSQLEIIEVFSSNVKLLDSSKLSSFVSHMTGISAKDLEEAKDFSEAAKYIQSKFDDDSILVYWSSQFMNAFIENYNAHNLNHSWIQDVKKICLQKSFTHFSGENRLISLDRALKMASFELEGARNIAEYDCKNTFNILVHIYKEIGISVLNYVNMNFGKDKWLKNQMRIFVKYQDVPLTWDNFTALSPAWLELMKKDISEIEIRSFKSAFEKLLQRYASE